MVESDGTTSGHGVIFIAAYLLPCLQKIFLNKTEITGRPQARLRISQIFKPA
jgi:hypothetical protein